MRVCLSLLPTMWLALADMAFAAPAPSPLKVPENVIVPAGGTGYLAVAIDRKQWNDKLSVKLQQLPTGVVVLNQPPEKTLEKDGAAALFTLLAAHDVPAGSKATLQVVASGPNSEITRSVQVSIVDFTMRPLSWLVMLLSVSSVLVLVSFCVWRVLTLPPVEEETLKGPLEIDTRDTDNAD